MQYFRGWSALGTFGSIVAQAADSSRRISHVVRVYSAAQFCRGSRLSVSSVLDRRKMTSWSATQATRAFGLITRMFGQLSCLEVACADSSVCLFGLHGRRTGVVPEEQQEVQSPRQAAAASVRACEPAGGHLCWGDGGLLQLNDFSNTGRQWRSSAGDPGRSLMLASYGALGLGGVSSFCSTTLTQRKVLPRPVFR